MAGQPYKYFSAPGYEQPESMDLQFIPPPDQWAALNLSGPTNLTVDWYTYDLLQEWLPDALTGSYYTNGSYYTTTSTDYIVQQLYDNLDSAPDQDVAPMFDIITMAMTDKFRRTCPNNLATIGTAIGIDTVLDVQWSWLILPTVVIALTVTFLGLTMFQSREHPLILWKDEVLPFVFHGLSPQAEMALKEGCIDNVEAMEKNARRLKVSLSEEEVELGISMRRMGTLSIRRSSEFIAIFAVSPERPCRTNVPCRPSTLIIGSSSA